MGRGTAQQEFEDAQTRFGRGDYAGALSLLDALNTAYPNKKNILYARARCFTALGDIPAAKELCIQCIAQWNAPRAQSLLELLEAEDASAEVESSFDDMDLESGLSAAFDVPDVPRELPKPRVSLIVTLVVGMLCVTGALFVSWQLGRPSGDAAAVFDQQELNRLYQARGIALVQEAAAPTERPGEKILASVWMRTAIDGLPDWKPGYYPDVPCPNAYYDAGGQTLQRTIDVYIPMMYQERPEELFPIVAISMAGPKRGFYGLSDWAELNDVILLTINTSSNKTYRYNAVAQAAAIATIFPTLRFDRRLGFAIGMSGGAATSWEMVCRYPENFAGLVSMGMADGHNGCWIAPHVRVAFIHGRDEPNNWAIKKVIPKLRRAGNEVREQVVAGAHVAGPLQVREKMLTWMLNAARREYGTMTIHDLVY